LSRLITGPNGNKKIPQNSKNFIFPSVAAPSFTSLIPNGDFEQGALPTGWTFSAGSGISTTKAYSPTHSLFVNLDGGPDPSESYATYTGTLLTPGTRYSLSFWIWCNTYASFNTYVNIGGVTNDMGWVVGSGSWKRVYLNNIPATFTSTFSFTVNTIGISEFYIDNVALIAGTVAP
jgi:hypothetical protein